MEGSYFHILMLRAVDFLMLFLSDAIWTNSANLSSPSKTDCHIINERALFLLLKKTCIWFTYEYLITIWIIKWIKWVNLCKLLFCTVVSLQRDAFDSVGAYYVYPFSANGIMLLLSWHIFVVGTLW